MTKFFILVFELHVCVVVRSSKVGVICLGIISVCRNNALPLSRVYKIASGCVCFIIKLVHQRASLFRCSLYRAGTGDSKWDSVRWNREVWLDPLLFLSNVVSRNDSNFKPLMITSKMCFTKHKHSDNVHSNFWNHKELLLLPYVCTWRWKANMRHLMLSNRL
jgi:hypothetical protein